jgi:TonB family protein
MTPRATHGPGAFETPQLDVRWQGRRENFVESFRAAFSGPRAPRHFDPSASFFRLRVAPGRTPGRGIAGSFVWHVILLAIAIPLSRMAMPKPRVSLPQIEITWYGPTTDVAPTPAPKPKESKPSPRPKPVPKRRILARAYNPKTTVIFNPPRPTNSRQVLIQPEAPPSAKFLTAMPNIISWTEAAPVRPEVEMNPAYLRARRRQEAEAELKAPQIVNATPPAGPLDIAPSDDTVKPPMPIAPSAVKARRAAAPRTSAAPSIANSAPDSKPFALSARAGPQLPLPPTSSAARAERSKSGPADNAAPNVTIDARRLVALSLSPGNAPPPPVNASAPISIGPHVAEAANSAAAPDLSASAASGDGAPGMPSANAARGPEGLLILHDSSGPKPVAPPPATAPRPLPKIAPVAPFSPRTALPRHRPAKPASKSGIVPNDLAHQVLGPWRIHTLLMNMPNLTSSSGSWILNFAEPLGKKMRESNEIIAPLPVHTVDPEYPPSEIEEGVQGTVILVAVIGIDGSVSQIRVVQSLDPVLDHNASVALSHWKFDPALLHREPVALKVLVSVPFHFSTAPR